ncbi:Zinc carboxypeptidase,Carboxypeptidase O,Carboxypeptidase B [Mytilus edulis]|uniref:Zinc carboxypeptidase,Carboxypeptidase O,Carboxypeptidase B n=1 Tax=Mytilus edulis TaxID=6550 RepID=A0A8S3SD37_MYTED|nr:Zinc carboxypeptidase,Carboxypeptidase O,Carboxypeptidase B [Mytilus edulis]
MVENKPVTVLVLLAGYFSWIYPCFLGPDNVGVTADYKIRWLSIWKRQRDGRSIDIQVSPNTIDFVTRELQDANTSYTRWIQNIQSLIDEQQVEEYEKAADSKDPEDTFSLTRYNTFEEISVFMHSLTKTTFTGPSGDEILVDHNAIGQTYEENSIHLIKISKPGSQKKAIFLESGIHAREWISPAVALYIVHQLSYNPSRSTAVEQLVADFDWYIVPVLNPDGYVYTHNKDRLWRKNRRQPSFGNNLTDICHGVDLNRNFGYKWGEGTSTDQCTETYSGPSPFSEPETLAVKRVLESRNINFLLYISFHSYGQYWMYPWGYTSTYTKDVKLLEFGAKIAVEALRQKYNTDYTVGSVYNALYAAEGVSLDYAKGQAGIKYCYTVELRDKDQYGFLLPQNQITPTCEETMDGIMALVGYIKALETK